MSRRLYGITLGSLLAASTGLLSAPVPATKDARSPRETEAAQDDLRQLRRRAVDPKSNQDQLWRVWQDFRLRHSGEPEFSQAAALMGRAHSPLDKLEREKIPVEDRLSWLPKEVVAVLGEHRGRHWEGVRKVAFSQDGKLVASMAESIRLWDATTMQERAIVKAGVEELPRVMTFVPHSGLLATVFGDDTIILWDISGAQPRAKTKLETRDWVSSLSFSADGRMMASRSQTEAIIWDMRGEKLVKRRVLKLAGRMSGAVALSDDGKLLALDDRIKAGPYKVQLWQLDQPTDKKPKVIADVKGPLAFVPNGKMLVTGMAATSGLRFWDISDDTPKQRDNLFGKETPGGHFAFSPDGAVLASVSYDGLRLWPLTDAARTKLKLLKRDTHARYELGFSPASVAFSPDGKTIVLGGNDGTVRLWDVARAAERFSLKGHRGIVNSVAFTPDVRSLVSGGSDRTVRWWGLTDAKPKELAVLTDHASEVAVVRCAPQGRYVVSNAGSEALKTDIRLWDFAEKKPKSRVILQSTTDITNNIAFPPNGKLFLASGGEGVPNAVGRALGRWYTPTISLWDFENGKLLERIVLHPPYGSEDKGRESEVVGFGGFRPNSQSFLYNLGAAWREWDMRSNGGRGLGLVKPEKLAGFRPIYSPDGTMLASIEEVTRAEDPSQVEHYLIRLCDVMGRSSRERLQIKSKGDFICRLAFVPDGKQLLTLDAGGHLRAWSTVSGRQVEEYLLPGQHHRGGPIPPIAIAPDGRHVAVGNPNGTIYILRLNILAETPATP